MRMLKRIGVLIFIIGFTLNSCSKKTQPTTSGQTKVPEPTGGPVMAAPPCIVYKTKADYSRNLPVILSDDKSKITSYPDVSDILKQGQSVYPSELEQGYLLDNRGIGPNVAFLKITYAEYSNNDETPPSTDLFQQLLDTDPLLEMYQCGNRYQYKDLVSELNQVIVQGKLSDCKKLK